MPWHAAGVVVAAECAAVEVEVREAVAGVDIEEVAAVGADIEAVVATAVAALAAPLRCRVHRHAHHRSTGRAAAAPRLGRGQATGICQRLAGDRAEESAVVPAPATSPVGQAAHDLGRVLVRALAAVLVSAHQASADVHRNEICRTFLTCRAQEAALPARVDLQLFQEEDMGQRRQAVRSPEALLPNSFATVPARFPAVARDRVTATLHQHCQRAPVADVPGMDWARVAGDPTWGDRGSRVIYQATLADPANPVTGLGILDDPVNPAIGQVTSAGQVGQAIDLEILVGRANRVEIMYRIFRVELVTAANGRTGARIISAISETGGRTTQATSMIGSTTLGGMTVTSTGRTTQDSATGLGRPGVG